MACGYDLFVCLCVWVCVCVCGCDVLSSKAYAGFYYSAAALYLSGTSTLDTFNYTMQNFCAMDWPTVSLPARLVTVPMVTGPYLMMCLGVNSMFGS